MGHQYRDKAAIIGVSKKYEGFDSEQVQVGDGVKQPEYFDCEQLKEVRVKFVLSDSCLIKGSQKCTAIFTADEDNLGLVFSNFEIIGNGITTVDKSILETLEHLRDRAETHLENKESFDIVEADTDE